MNSKLEHSAAQTVRTFWEAQQNGDRQTASALLSESLIWRVAGNHSAVARTYHGREAFFRELIGTLGQTFVTGTVQLEIRGIYSDASQSMVTSHIHETAEAQNGLSFDIEIITLMKVVDGMITTCDEFMDLHEVRRVFGQ